jgi:hypothetical protein
VFEAAGRCWVQPRQAASVTDTMTAVGPRSLHPPASAGRPDGRARVDAAVRLASGAGLWLSLLLVGWWWAPAAGSGTSAAGRAT